MSGYTQQNGHPLIDAIRVWLPRAQRVAAAVVSASHRDAAAAAVKPRVTRHLERGRYHLDEAQRTRSDAAARVAVGNFREVIALAPQHIRDQVDKAPERSSPHLRTTNERTR